MAQHGANSKSDNKTQSFVEAYYITTSSGRRRRITASIVCKCHCAGSIKRCAQFPLLFFIAHDLIRQETMRRLLDSDSVAMCPSDHVIAPSRAFFSNVDQRKCTTNLESNSAKPLIGYGQYSRGGTSSRQSGDRILTSARQAAHLVRCINTYKSGQPCA